jgi:hypothetical protein
MEYIEGTPPGGPLAPPEAVRLRGPADSDEALCNSDPAEFRVSGGRRARAVARRRDPAHDSAPAWIRRHLQARKALLLAAGRKADSRAEIPRLSAPGNHRACGSRRTRRHPHGLGGPPLPRDDWNITATFAWRLNGTRWTNSLVG